MKTKKKYKASGGAAFVTMAQGGQDLWQANADSMLNRYGYQTQPGKASYHMGGTGRNKAGGVSGAYTDLQKFLEEPEQKVKSKDFGLLNTLNTVVSMGSALVSGSAGSIKDALNKPKPDAKPAPSDSLMGNNLNTDPSLGNVGEQMGSGKSLNMAGVSPIQSKPTFTPSAVNAPQKVANVFPVSKDNSSLFGDNMKDTKPTLHGETDEFSLLGDGTAQLKQGGKNPKQATPVEAEGGEVEVTWDDSYNITNTKPIVGPSHSEGGVDLKLPKNHAILNKEQQGRLSKGESLKSILDSLPNVNNAGKAQTGIENDDPYNVTPRMNWLKKNKIGDPYETFGQPGVDSSGYHDWLNKNYPHASLTSPDWNYVNRQFMATKKADSLMNDKWLKGFQTGRQPIPARTMGGEIGIPLTEPIKMPTQNPQVSPQPTPDTPPESPSLLNTPNLSFMPPKPSEISMPGSGMLQSKTTNIVPGSTEPMSLAGVEKQNDEYPQTDGTKNGNKFKFGYPEEKALTDVAQNLVSLFQPRAQGVKVNAVSVGSPTLTTPRPVNNQNALNEVSKNINAGISRLTQTGRSDMIPSLISAGLESVNKIGEGTAQVNAQLESQSQGENARSSNQFSLAQASLDSDTIKENARLELEHLRVLGQQDTERAKSLQAILAEPAAYDREKQNQKIRDLAYARLQTEMYMRH